MHIHYRGMSWGQIVISLIVFFVWKPIPTFYKSDIWTQNWYHFVFVKKWYIPVFHTKSVINDTTFCYISYHICWQYVDSYALFTLNNPASYTWHFRFCYLVMMLMLFGFQLYYRQNHPSWVCLYYRQNLPSWVCLLSAGDRRRQGSLHGGPHSHWQSQGLCGGLCRALGFPWRSYWPRHPVMPARSPGPASSLLLSWTLPLQPEMFQQQPLNILWSCFK